MRMVSFICNDDGTFAPCSQGGEDFLTEYRAALAAKEKAERALIDDRGCDTCRGGCPDKDHHVTRRFCEECYQSDYIKPIKWMQDERDCLIAAKEAAETHAEEYKEAGLEASNTAISLQATVMKLEFEKETLETQVKTLEEYMLKGVAFRDELQAQLCRAGEALQYVAARGHQHWCPTTKNSLPEQYCECHLLVINPALSSSAPCPHEEEAKRLRETIESIKMDVSCHFTPCLPECAHAGALDQIHEKADNLLHAAALPVPNHIHIEGLKGGMEDIKKMAELRRADAGGGGGE